MNDNLAHDFSVNIVFAERYGFDSSHVLTRWFVITEVLEAIAWIPKISICIRWASQLPELGDSIPRFCSPNGLVPDNFAIEAITLECFSMRESSYLSAILYIS